MIWLGRLMKTCTLYKGTKKRQKKVKGDNLRVGRSGTKHPLTSSNFPPPRMLPSVNIDKFNFYWPWQGYCV
jgi:hypothetical protein